MDSNGEFPRITGRGAEIAAAKMERAARLIDESNSAMIQCLNDFISRFETAVAAMPYEFPKEKNG